MSNVGREREGAMVESFAELLARTSELTLDASADAEGVKKLRRAADCLCRAEDIARSSKVESRPGERCAHRSQLQRRKPERTMDTLPNVNEYYRQCCTPW